MNFPLNKTNWHRGMCVLSTTLVKLQIAFTFICRIEIFQYADKTQLFDT